MKILCKNCNKSFEHGESLKGRVIFQKCSRVFKIIYDIKIICPSCSTIIQPINDGKKVIGVTMQEIAHNLREEAKGNHSKSYQEELKRKEKLAKALREIKNRLSSNNANTRVTKRKTLTGKKNAVEDSIDTFEHISFDNVRDITSASKKVLMPKNNGREDTKTSKNAKLKKKIGLCVLLLMFGIAVTQVLPDLMYSKSTHAIKRAYKTHFPKIKESLPQAGTVVDNSENVIDLTELSKLFDKTTQDSSLDSKQNKDKNISETKHKPLKKSKASDNKKQTKSKAFKQLLARLNISSGFGQRIHPITGKKHFHTGIDIPRRYRSPIKSLMGGKVEFSGYQRGYGNLVIIQHKGGIKTYYGHNAKNTVLKGDYVKKGETIGYIGMTGNTTGPHLHFEIRKNNIPINPLNYLEKLLMKYKRVII